MSDNHSFLLEIYSEEIPARMQLKAIESFASMFDKYLNENKISYNKLEKYITPNRMVISVDGLAKKQPDISEEKKGPKVGANEKAIEGFCKSVGLTIEQLEIRNLGNKGEFYYAVIQKNGVETPRILADITNNILDEFVWEKSMRWGSNNARWVRPIRSIIAIFDDNILDVEFAGVAASNIVTGHRIMSGNSKKVANFAEYSQFLANQSVILDNSTRKQQILNDAKKLAQDIGGTLDYNEYLLDEVTGLCEYPVLLRGQIDDEFMALPDEVLISSIRTHQKYFCVRGKNGALLPYFIFASNIDTADNDIIIAGNQKVLRARLSDAVFFWQQDIKHPLIDNAVKLSGITFHNKLGTVADKVQRIESNAKFCAMWISHANVADISRASQLCKADLVTEMVGEFPELQGLIGSYYATEQGEKPEIANAIAEHYSPLGPKDACPKAPTSVAISIADKIDSIAGMFAIGQKPTGSKDPYALRRATLGILRMILSNGLSFQLPLLLSNAVKQYPAKLVDSNFEARGGIIKKIASKITSHHDEVVAEIESFFIERLTHMFKNDDIREDIIQSIYNGSGKKNVLDTVKRTKHISDFLQADGSDMFLSSFKRVSSILEKEEQEMKGKIKASKLSDKYFTTDEEQQLFGQLDNAKTAVAQFIAENHYDKACIRLATLSPYINKYLDDVQISCDDDNIRLNRLRLLASVRDVVHLIGRFESF